MPVDAGRFGPLLVGHAAFAVAEAGAEPVADTRVQEMAVGVLPAITEEHLKPRAGRGRFTAAEDAQLVGQDADAAAGGDTAWGPGVNTGGQAEGEQGQRDQPWAGNPSTHRLYEIRTQCV